MDGSVIGIEQVDGFIGAHQSYSTDASCGLMTSTTIKAISLYYRRFIGLWNEMAVAKKRTALLLSMPSNRDLARVGRNTHAMAVAESINQIGFDAAMERHRDVVMLYPDKMDVIQQVLMALRSSVDLIALAAETQWGKTLVMTFVSFLHQMYLEDQNIRDTVLIACPPRNNPKLQTSGAAVGYRGLHGALRFKAGDTMLMVANGDANIKRVTKRFDAMMRQTINEQSQRIEGKCGTITVLIDEADEAANLNSALDKLVLSCKRLKVRLRFCGVSATGFAYNHSQNFVTIKAEVGSDYAGILTGTRIPIIAFEKAAALGNVRLDSRAKTSVLEDFNLAQDYRNRASEVYAFIERMMTVGISSPDHRLLGMPCNGGMGATLRYGNTEQLMAGLLPLLEKRLPKLGIRVIRVFGDLLRTLAKKSMTISDHVKTVVKPGERYLLVVCGAGRRADQFPTDCSVFFDFTDRFSYMESFIQGSCGRATGYNKFVPGKRQVVVFLSSHNAEIVADWRRTGAAPLPFRTAVSVDRTRRTLHRTGEVHFSDPRFASNAAQGLRDQIEAALAGQVVVKPVNRVKLRKDGTRMKNYNITSGGYETASKLSRHTAALPDYSLKTKPVRLYADVFGILGKTGIDTMRTLMKSRYGVEVDLLMPGEASVEGHTLPTSKDAGYERYIRIALGDFNRNQTSTSDTSNRMSRLTGPSQRLSLKEKANERTINLLFAKQKGGGVRLMSISMPFAHPVRAAPNSTVTLAKSTNIYFGFQTAAEKQIVRDITSGKAAKTQHGRRRV